MSLLEVVSLSKEFGGLKAVQDVGFAVEAGVVHSVIGPNGAGKTTLFNLITGVYTPTQGEIRLDGVDVAGRRPDQLAALGVARTFQNLQICMNMDACENVMVGAHLRLDRNVIRAALRWPGLVRRDRAKLTPDRAAYIAHPDWVAAAGTQPPAALWQPALATDEALAETVRWYREQGWL